MIFNCEVSHGYAEINAKELLAKCLDALAYIKIEQEESAKRWKERGNNEMSDRACVFRIEEENGLSKMVALCQLVDDGSVFVSDDFAMMLRNRLREKQLKENQSE